MTASERAELCRLLAGHVPADAWEAEDLEQIREFAAACPEPFSRRTWPGHLTASAFVIAGDRVLLTHHRRLGIWIQLGGHASGENAAPDVALREAREESGLDDLSFHPALRFPDGTPRLLDVDVHRIPAHGEEPEHEHLDLRFLMATARPEAIVVAADESRGLEWVTLTEALRRGDPGLARAVAKIERLLPGSGEKSS